MPFPMTPAQAAILGKTRPAPSATVNAAGAVPSARPPTGQTPVPVATPAAAGLGFTPNSMDEFLLGRANRQEPIRGGVGLLGRLAALGVGNKIQRENEKGAREETVAQLVALGMDKNQAELVAKGVLSPPKPAEEKERKTFKDGTGRTRYQDTGELLPGEVPEGEALDTLSPEAEEQKARIAREGRSSVTTNVKNLTGPAASIDSLNQALETNKITPEQYDKAIEKQLETTRDKAGATQEVKDEAVRKEMRPVFNLSVSNIRKAAERLAVNPLDAEAKLLYEANIKNLAIARTKILEPTAAVMADDKTSLIETFPSPQEIFGMAQLGQDPVSVMLENEIATFGNKESQGGPTPPEGHGQVEEIMKKLPEGAKFLGFE